MNMTLEAKKIKLMQWLLAFNDERTIDTLMQYASVESEQTAAYFAPELSEKPDPFKLKTVEIRSGATKDDLFAEQNKQPLRYEELNHIVGNVQWKHSLGEMLAALD